MNPELLALTPAQIQFCIETLETRLLLMRNVLARKAAEDELDGKVDSETLDALIAIAKQAP
jgi:hypothetical protein